MKKIVSAIAIIVVIFVMSACKTQQTFEPQTTIGINQYDKQKLGEWTKCPTCSGHGNCIECKGKGKKNNSTCVKCNGTGKCISCEGQGGWRAEVRQ